jgi:hypothetical protein
MAVGGGDNQQNLPPPPPRGQVPSWEDILQRDEAHRQATQQVMGRMSQLMENMQANQHGAQPPLLRGYHGFVWTDPPIFSGARDPMAANHWLKTMEQKFTLI